MPIPRKAPFSPRAKSPGWQGYSIDVRRQVRAYYVFDHLSIDQAAEKAGVGLRTARRWKAESLRAGDDWDLARAAATISREGMRGMAQVVLQDYITQHHATLKSLRDYDEEVEKARAEGRHLEPLSPLQRSEILGRLSDSFHKAMAAYSKLQPELSRLAIATDVIRLLTRYVQEHYPQHAPALLEVLEPFGEVITREFGRT